MGGQQTLRSPDVAWLESAVTLTRKGKFLKRERHHYRDTTMALMTHLASADHLRLCELAAQELEMVHGDRHGAGKLQEFHFLARASHSF